MATLPPGRKRPYQEVPTWRPCLASARIGPRRRGGQARAARLEPGPGIEALRVEFATPGGYNLSGKIIGQTAEFGGNRFHVSRGGSVEGAELKVDYAIARQHMVDSQVRTNKVTDERLIEAIRSLPRERFVPERARARAYLDDDLEIAPGRYLMEPMVTARLIQAAEAKPDDMALVVGAGTGYAAALLSRLVNTAVALETDPVLAQRASAVLAELAIDNAAVVEGALNDGCAKHAPYNILYLDGAVEQVPPALTNQLADGGRMVGVLLDRGVGRAALWIKSGNAVSHRVLFDANVGLLPGFAAPARFVF
jgi:protein-L-isoaspartate(D-aspartate) O-methyltransferase